MPSKPPQRIQDFSRSYVVVQSVKLCQATDYHISSEGRTEVALVKATNEKWPHDDLPTVFCSVHFFCAPELAPRVGDVLQVAVLSNPFPNDPVNIWRQPHRQTS